jgi:hypothetical protein
LRGFNLQWRLTLTPMRRVAKKYSILRKLVE